jgi:hypothetical protein
MVDESALGIRSGDPSDGFSLRFYITIAIEVSNNDDDFDFDFDAITMKLLCSRDSIERSL